MSAIDKVIALAKSEVGYREKASNSQLDDPTANAGSGNYTKYARDLDQISGFYNGAKNGYAWCDIFVDWLFVKCFGVSKARAMLYQFNNQEGAGCTYSLGYYRTHGAFYSSPQVGDQIFFGRVAASTHTGIVVGVDSSNVYTVEGNTSDGVYSRTYSLGSSSIAGYGRPNWAAAGDDTGDETTEETTTMAATVTTATVGSAFTLTLHILKKGSTGEAVRVLQVLLINAGYDLGGYGADGDFGSATDKAVKQYQSDHGLEADGEVGAKTMAALLGL